MSGEDRRFIGSTPFEFGSVDFDANGELGRFRCSPEKKNYKINIFIIINYKRIASTLPAIIIYISTYILCDLLMY